MSSLHQQRPATAKETCFRRLRSSLWGFVFVLGVLMFTGIPNAGAAVVTTNEIGVDGVYSQPNFGSTDVDILFNSAITFENGSLLNITTEAQLNALFAFNDTFATDVISIYFVDTLDWCDGFSTAIIGCAVLGGNDIVVESEAALGTFGTELIAHEIGHSLGLDHVAFANLMTASLNENTDLTPGQVSDILNSSFIQFGASGQFVEVTPVLVTPLPPALLMFVSALLVLFGVHRRKKVSV